MDFAADLSPVLSGIRRKTADLKPARPQRIIFLYDMLAASGKKRFSQENDFDRMALQ